MANYSFSVLANGQHIAFNSAVDSLLFAATVSAGSLSLAESGNALSITLSGKTVWLDNTLLGSLTNGSLQFANGGSLWTGDGTTDTLADWYGANYSSLASSKVGNWVDGLGGGDLVQTGSGADWLLGNIALTSINHISHSGGFGSPSGSSTPSISADGRYVGFAGGWTGFGSQNNNATDVFVKDINSGIVTDEHKSSAGLFGNSGSGSPVISDDGKSLAFSSASSNLGTVTGSSLYEIYVAAVGSISIERVSTGTGGTVAANGRSLNPDISGNGRYVVFESNTSNWNSGGSTVQSDIFLKDRTSGTLTRISTSLSSTDGNNESASAKVSNDGRFVVFESAASNLTSGDTNGNIDIFIWDRASNVANKLTNLTSLMTSAINPNNSCLNPDIAYDNGWGGKIAFETARGLVAGDTNNATDIYVYDIADNRFQLASSKLDGSMANLSSSDASISGDGRFVVFTSSATNLVAGDTNGYADIFVKDLYTNEIALVSRAANGTQANQSSGHAKISLGGEWIVFETSASNLSSTDGNGGFNDVYRASNPLLRDTLVGGGGNDSYVINRNDTISEAIGGGTDVVRTTISYALGANLENLVLLGTGALNGTGNALNNIIWGNSGNNVINGGAGNDGASYSYASSAVSVNLSNLISQNTVGAGNDTLLNVENLYGSNFNDQLTGDANSNVLNGGIGNDTLTGGLGNDTYVVDSNADIIRELSAVLIEIDSVQSSLSWTLGAFLENLTLTGSAAINGSGNSKDNILIGNAAANVMNGYMGNDVLNGGVGNDTMVGGSGSDTYYVTETADVVTETDAATATGGTDLVNSYLATYTLGANIENGRIVVATASNLSGNALGNVLYAGAGNNVIDGGVGVDTLSYVYGVASTTGVTVNLGLTTTQVTGGSGSDTLLNIENLTGSAYADKLTGNSLSNVLDGGAGNDTLTGGLGNDTYVVNSTLDVVIEATTSPTEIDTVQAAVSWTLGGNLESLTLLGVAAINGTGNSLANTLVGNTAGNVLDGGAGNDTLIGGAGVDTLIGGTGNDTYVVNFSSTTGLEDVFVESSTLATEIDTLKLTGVSANTSAVTLTLNGNIENVDYSATGTTLLNVTGSAVSNVLTGNSAVNILDGGAGNDTLIGGAGVDTLIGGAGNDTYIVNFSATTGLEDLVVESSTLATEIDTLKLTGFSPHLSAVTLSLTGYLENVDYSATGATLLNITGGAVSNVLTGNSASNVLDGGAGNDTLIGGAGVDTLIGGTGNDTYVVNFSTTTGMEDVFVESSTLATEIDTLKLTGVSANTSAVTLSLTGNIENVDYSATGTTLLNVTGSAVSNVLTGNSAINVLDGGAGNDTLIGGAGIDTLIGGDGSDTYYVQDAGDVVTETNALAATGGTDLANSYLAAYTLGANVENGRIVVATAANLTGNALNNVLYAGTGNNVIDGGTGADTLSYAYGLVSTTGVTVSLGVATAQATGGSGSDTLLNIEHLVGSAYADSLTGNAVANVLDGGAGNDTLTGGLGLDIFQFDTALNASTNKDTISDFSVADDTIRLENAIFTGLPTVGPLSAAAFHSGVGVVAAHDADDRVLYNTTTGALYYDADGTGAGLAVQFALVGTTTHAAMTVADFAVI